MAKRSPVIDAALACLPAEERWRAKQVFEDVYRELRYDGLKQATVTEPDLVALAGEMIRDSYIEEKTRKAAERVKQRRELSAEQFLLAACEAYDLDESDAYDFDPGTCTVHSRRRRRRTNPSSVEKSIERYAEVIENALDAP
jgi:hypothetical protein